jgi:uncharacterized protein
LGLTAERFLLDEMLAGLARWLRAAGYDTALAPPGMADIDLRAQAHREGRVLVTRDRLLGAAPGAVLLAADKLEAQAREFGERMGIDWLKAPFSRCVMDNSLLAPAGPADLQRMPEETRALPGPFRVCPSCGRVYWPGSHVRRMRARLEGWKATTNTPSSSGAA